MALFSPRKIVDDDTADWLIDHIQLLIEAYGRDRFFDRTELILPEPRFFAARSGTDPATAEAVVADIQRHMGLSGWPVTLHRLPGLDPEHRHTFQSTSEVSGTFQLFEDGAVISYRPEMLETPILFISVMAHELAHYLLADLDFDGTEAEHELLTDLATIWSGFGIFQMMAADAMGWAGYMSQESRAYALALFLRSKDLPEELLLRHLARRSLKLVRSALAMADRNPEDIDALRTA